MDDVVLIYLFTARGRQGDARQGVGIGAHVMDGPGVRLFKGHGYASDGEFPRAYATYQLLDLFPGRNFKLYTEGFQKRLQDFHLGGGKTTKGKPYVGSEYLAEISKARSRLTIMRPPSGFSPEYLMAKHAARDALKQLEERPESRNLVPVVLSKNHILGFKEVP
ncbi:hypothetical protein [Rhizobium sp. ZX09]|uniref:hypothetical protein n=1 Tax=Rhizobium sp. ZX09 TaxID=2291939 RepID=UPI001A982DD9|nr:hypothetical protein [Rhizobium sp. ZX09]QSZ56309.1 hypothetical protein BTN45_03610 [Rhizobium sp. ZX09]